MLTIQRASAGSGKTYTLAKKYILNLIAYKKSKDKWLLRNKRQIEDAIQHILAITFTNKATNEMKQRIVENLSQLATAEYADINDKYINSVSYLRDFQHFLKSDYKSIGIAASHALKIILNNYSLFKISTIDSFFQEILRTFTFEANINDSYQLEIDSTFINENALDSAIHELDTHPSKMGHAALWFKILMKEEATNSQIWNPFSKRASSRSIYSRLRQALQQLGKEDFKSIKEALDIYFSDPIKVQQLPRIYFTLRDFAIKERDNQLKRLRQHLNNIENLILSNGYSEKELQSTFLNKLPKIRNFNKDTAKIDFQFNKILTDQTVFKKKYFTPNNPLDIEALQMFELLNNWIPKDSYYKAWKIYSPLLPYLGLILETRAFLSQVLESNNLIQLSDTSYILQKIIRNDDAPFVFERLGNRINHFLIDEFQDTSRMQWQILYPLLNESIAQGKDSLIIGDPKQSIYRFRNAEHSLITKVVPNTFKNHVEEGKTPEENTNWRSHTQIVEFNNHFFTALANEMTILSASNGGATDFSDLYKNVIQKPNNEEGKGYVEIKFFQKPENTDDTDDISENPEDAKGWFEKVVLDNIPVLVSSLIKRNYQQEDICILVNTNNEGKQVIKSLISYNDNLPPNSEHINFLSEESLLVSSSQAIEFIIGVLSKIAYPIKKISEKEGKNTKQRYFNWDTLKSDFDIFAGKHKELSQLEKLMTFLNQEDTEINLNEFMKHLSAPTLPALVETIISRFLDEDSLKSEALYLSSFQDIVAEFSAGFQDDPALFLEWWYSKGCRMSVTAPEGTNAVQIMTIHKSKGLEFKCVIVPFANDRFTYLKDEWRWIVPHQYPGIEFPPVVPIKTNSMLKNSNHERIYNEFYDQVLTDKLNMYYVAFTRAKNELYIFTKQSLKISSSMGDFLKRFTSPQNFEPSSYNLQKLNFNEETVSFGSPLTPEDICEDYKKDKRKNTSFTKTHFFENYFVNKKQPHLLSKSTTLNPSSDL